MIANRAALCRAVMILVTSTCLTAVPAAAQTPAPAPARADDTPSIRLGATIFTDFTTTREPTIRDADGNDVSPSAFNIGRAYLNVTGSISRLIAFRVTPDVARETGTGSSLAGSMTFRLKFAFAQFNLDEWLTPGSFVRVGMQQNPWVDFIDSVYRYRFQGPSFEDREGLEPSSDTGATFRYVFKGNFGDVHGGIFNGEGYTRAEPNDQKGFRVRATVRPLPERPALRGLRVTGFYNHDAYVRDAERRRGIGAVTYEHPRINAGVSVLATADQPRIASPRLLGRGFSIWATPKTPKGWGWEGLIRFDRLTQQQALSSIDSERERTIAGIAYWFPRQGAVSAAVLFDYEQVNNNHFVPVRANERRWAVHTLINF